MAASPQGGYQTGSMNSPAGRLRLEPHTPGEEHHDSGQEEAQESLKASVSIRVLLFRP